jgi:hypothetical protein
VTTDDFFLDFERSLEGLDAEDLMKTVHTFLSKGVVACQKGFERAAAEAKTSLEKQKTSGGREPALEGGEREIETGVLSAGGAARKAARCHGCFEERTGIELEML